MVSDAQVINPKAVTEMRFRYGRDDERQAPATSLPSLTVLGAFTSGGSILGRTNTVSDSYQLQDYTSVSLSKHFLKFGPAPAR